ncbi:hypothetical protein [Chitinophaga filiformis]|uniref:Uncharacterized protein n=1 Tax=Chitinophaga filiformis TaxID=104663 RepID=A0ABY4I3L5_CHIFI|nr:hypothetical protein [Chitinophaga filiformis]UPK70683.1 hypothetical protein MYF79_05150 [Chitinophaga filiformis]
MKTNSNKKPAHAKKATSTVNRFPGVDNNKLIKVQVGTVKEGSTKVIPTQFTLPNQQ